MYRLLFLLFLALFSAVHALSSTGSRLLVVTEDSAADKEKYSTFWSDLESLSTQISIQWILQTYNRNRPRLQVSF